MTPTVEALSDGDKLRLLARWFEMWDRPETDRQAILDDPRNPGRNEVQQDLRRIAVTLDRSTVPDEGALREAAQGVLDAWPGVEDPEADYGIRAIAAIERLERVLAATPKDERDARLDVDEVLPVIPPGDQPSQQFRAGWLAARAAVRAALAATPKDEPDAPLDVPTALKALDHIERLAKGRISFGHIVILVREARAALSKESTGGPEHRWTPYDRGGYDICRVCLLVRQADGSTDTKPCKPAGVALRESTGG